MKRWDAALYEGKHSFVWRYGSEVVELLAPGRGERILDLGCGTGALTAEISASGAEVVGIDVSSEMVEQARRNHPHLRFEVADARSFRFDEPFDAVFSNATLHWVRDQEPAVRSVHRALKPGGRFVAELGGKGNIAGIAAAIYEAFEELDIQVGEDPNPWYFPSVGEYATLLESNGFEVGYAALFDRPTTLEDGEAGLRNWMEMFCGSFLAAVPGEKREEFMRSVESRLRPRLYRQGAWVADYRRLRVSAVRL